MRISRIELRNYRQFKHAVLLFTKKSGTDLHIFIGRNTAGKTNILNAINWCLYEDEPHVTAQYQGLEIPNLLAVDEIADEGEIPVVVEITVESDDRDSHVFRREQVFRIHGRQKPTLQRTEFQARFQGDDGNTVILKDDDATEYVQRFVPNNIREYFFFDGERLDNYFKEEAGQKIRHAVFQIAQIDLLARVNCHLADLVHDLEKQAARISPALEGIRTRLEKAKEEEADCNIRFAECEKQLLAAEDGTVKYTQKISGLPAVESLEAERKQLGSQVEGLQKMLRDKEDEKGEVLFKFGVRLNIHEALRNAIAVIDDKTKAREIPPAIKTEILEDALANGRCIVCGTELTDVSRICVQELLREVSLSSEVAHELHRIEGPLRMMVDETMQFDKGIRKVTREMETIKNQIDSLQQRREEIDSDLAGYDVEEVRHWQAMRKEFEQTARSLRENRGVLKDAQNRKTKEVEELQKKLHTELKAEQAAGELQLQIEVCSSARAAAYRAEQAVMTKTRSFIEQKTSETFMELVWRKSTYEDVTIEENYHISVHHSMGYDALGTLSAAERELLALSFTLALHEVSGFEGPLLIDTPVARVSDSHRENFAQALLRVAKRGKQIILLFTPDEYTSTVSKHLENDAASRHEIRLQQNERESKVEDLTNGERT